MEGVGVDWVIVEVVVGLSFLFFVLSIVASAVNEGIAGVFKLRSRTLEQGIVNLVTGARDRDDSEGIQMVARIYDHPLIGGYGRGGAKPSYLSSRSFRNALFDLTGLLDATGEPVDDPLRAEEVRRQVDERLAAIPSESLRETLRLIWRSAHHEAGEFRAGVERWFDRGMERVSGWYKRRAQIILLVIGIVLAAALNADTLRVTDNLWRDEGLRQALVAQVEDADEDLDAEQALDRLEELQFPIGWQEANRPDDGGEWAMAVLGWVLTAIALSVGAPFWFDLLGRVSNLRAAGRKPESVLAPTAAGDRATGTAGT